MADYSFAFFQALSKAVAQARASQAVLLMATLVEHHKYFIVF